MKKNWITKSIIIAVGVALLVIFIVNAANNKKRIDEERAESARQSEEAAKEMEDLYRKSDVHFDTGNPIKPVAIEEGEGVDSNNEETTNAPKVVEEVVKNNDNAEQPRQKTHYEIFESLAKKHDLLGIWSMGSGAYCTIIKKGGRYYYGSVDVINESVVCTDEVLKRISANKYQGMAAYDMPENLVIDEAGNLVTYVYNPDFDEWVYFGEKIRVY